jgi:hypothetical protein
MNKLDGKKITYGQLLQVRGLEEKRIFHWEETKR